MFPVDINTLWFGHYEPCGFMLSITLTLAHLKQLYLTAIDNDVKQVYI